MQTCKITTIQMLIGNNTRKEYSKRNDKLAAFIHPYIILYNKHGGYVRRRCLLCSYNTITHCVCYVVVYCLNRAATLHFLSPCVYFQFSTKYALHRHHHHNRHNHNTVKTNRNTFVINGGTKGTEAACFVG